MTKIFDLEYRMDGFFTSFIPNTPEGVEAWKTIAEHTDGTGKVFTSQAAGTIAQLRRAGYSVRKALPVTDISLDDILGELTE